jgi:hypothetical protein
MSMIIFILIQDIYKEIVLSILQTKIIVLVIF